MAKFMARYKSQYIVTSQLCENTYFLKDVSDLQATPIIANVQQMKLLQRDSQTLVELEEGTDAEPHNLALLEEWEKRYERASLCASADKGAFPKLLQGTAIIRDLRSQLENVKQEAVFPVISVEELPPALK